MSFTLCAMVSESRDLKKAFDAELAYYGYADYALMVDAELYAVIRVRPNKADFICFRTPYGKLPEVTTFSDIQEKLVLHEPGDDDTRKIYYLLTELEPTDATEFDLTSLIERMMQDM